jgi:hypothetical protein
VHYEVVSTSQPNQAQAIRAFAIKQLYQQIGQITIGQLLGRNVADQRVDLGRWALVLLLEGSFDGLLAGMGHDF